MPDQISYEAGRRLYLHVTDRCTLECSFCPKAQGSRRIGDWNLEHERRPSASDLIERVGDPTRFEEIVFSGLGEPTLRLNLVLEVAAEIKRRGGRVRLDTDGLANLVHDRDVLPAMNGLVDAVSVSLNAQDETAYDRQCRPNLPGSFTAMTSFLSQALRHIPRVRATAIDGLPAVDIAACARLAHGLGVGFRIRQHGEIL